MCTKVIFNLFWPMFPFYTPSENQRFSGIFRGYKMRILARSRLIISSFSGKLFSRSILDSHCLKYARIRVSCDRIFSNYGII